MMRRRSSRYASAFFAICVAAGSACGFDFDLYTGTITVTNIGDSESAVVAILADDAKSYPTLTPGASATVKTNVGGVYRVTVVMTRENAIGYRESLLALRTLVEKQIDRSTSVVEKTKLFIDLAGIKAAIVSSVQDSAATCNGRVDVSESDAEVSATVRWSPAGESGFWDMTCGSD